MKLPIQISFHNVARSDAVEELVRTCAARLDQFCDRLMSCRVVIDQPHRHHRDGNLFHVRISITAPGEEIIINREPRQHVAYRDLETAIGDAFDQAIRCVQDHARRLRRETKSHHPPAHARVSRLFPEAGYGFLHTHDNRDIYFHQDSLVASNFEQLLIGMEVAFNEELGEKGPQATAVRIVGRHHHL